MALLKMPLREVLPKSVLSDFRSNLRVDDNLCSDVEDWTIEPNTKNVEVIQDEKLTVPHDGRPYSVETKELYMIWPPGEMTLSDDCGANNKHCKTPLSVKQLVTLTVDTELNMKNRMMQDTKMQSSLIRVKRRYLVEIPISTFGRRTGGGDATNVWVIHTTLLMVTAHCQLSIQTHGQEAVMIPSLEDILAYGDGRPSKLTHSTSVDSGYQSPTSPSLGSIDGPNLFGQMLKGVNESPADNGQQQTTVVQHIIQNEAIGADDDKLRTQSSVDSGLGVEDRNRLSRQITEEGFVVEVSEKADMVDQQALGELVRETIGGLVPVESREKDVNVTDSQNEGIEEFVDLEPADDFERYNCCDVLFPIKKDTACQATVKFYEKFCSGYSNGKKFVIKSFDDYHQYGIDADFEALIRASKIMFYLAPKCSDRSCPDCYAEKKNDYLDKLFQEVSTTVGDEKVEHIIITVKRKDFKWTSEPKEKNCLLRHACECKEDGVLQKKSNLEEKIIHKREKTINFACQYEEKKSAKSQPAMPSVSSLPLQRSSSEEKQSSPHSRVECFNPNTVTDERTDILILCCDCEVDATQQLQERIKEGGRSLKIGTPVKFHYLGLEKTQVAIAKADRVIIYASPLYAKDTTMTKALDWKKAIDEIQDKLVVVVPKGTSHADYDDYKMDLKLVSAVPTYFEDTITDMTPLIKWLAPKHQAQICSYG